MRNADREARTARGLEAYKPLFELLREDLLTANELADHVQLTTYALHLQRRRETGVSFLQLPGGRAIRYRLSDVVAAEIQGSAGRLTAGRVCLALAACEDMSPQARLAAQEAVRKAFG